jgi:hypothetical protein
VSFATSAFHRAWHNARLMADAVDGGIGSRSARGNSIGGTGSARAARTKRSLRKTAGNVSGVRGGALHLDLPC